MRLSNKAKLLQKDSPAVKSVSTKPVIHKQVDQGVISRESMSPGPVDYDREMYKVINSLNRAGVQMMSVPAAKRHEAFLLDQRLTQAANGNKPAEFLKLLKQWRQCFH